MQLTSSHVLELSTGLKLSATLMGPEENPMTLKLSRLEKFPYDITLDKTVFRAAQN